MTVAICTWNRSASLAEMLSSLSRVHVPSDVTWDCLVVNNNSTDDTDAVIDSFADRLPIRRVLEPKQGHSRARNTAIVHAAGDLILWLDDDVRVSTGWLAGYVRAAERWPGAAYFGGRIRPRYTSDPPRWVAPNLRLLGGPFRIRDFGDHEGLFPEGEAPYGGNMAVRRRVLGPNAFDERLGLRGGYRRIGEETALFHRLRQQGEFGVWVPAADVLHPVHASQFTVGYLRSHFAEYGRSVVRRHEGRQAWILGWPRWILRACCVLANATARCDRVLGGTAWVPVLARCAKWEGMIDESRASAGDG